LRLRIFKSRYVWCDAKSIDLTFQIQLCLFDSNCSYAVHYGVTLLFAKTIAAFLVSTGRYSELVGVRPTHYNRVMSFGTLKKTLDHHRQETAQVQWRVPV
jgi:hypothetical protein